MDGTIGQPFIKSGGYMLRYDISTRIGERVRLS